MTQPGCVLRALCIAALQLGCVHAASYPARPVHLVVPFAPGGSTDIVARVLSQQLGQRLGDQVVIENRAGAGGNIGSEFIARAAADGHWLLIGTVGTLAINPSLYKSMPYDPLKDLTPVALLGSTANVLVVHPSLPATSVQGLIVIARARPRELKYGSAGLGGSVHLAAELFKSMAKADMLHVPYKGTGPALIELLAGETQLMFSTLPPAAPHVRSGRLRALGVTGARRSPIFPRLPTIAEAGLPGYEVAQWWALLGPALLPVALVTRLNGEINAALQQPQVQERLAAEGVETAAKSPAWLAAHIRAETERWAKIVRSAGVPAE